MPFPNVCIRACVYYLLNMVPVEYQSAMRLIPSSLELRRWQFSQPMPRVEVEELQAALDMAQDLPRVRAIMFDEVQI